MENKQVDLRLLAKQTMEKKGFLVSASKELLQEVEELKTTCFSDSYESSLMDLRSLPWSSIDNYDSNDLDQIEVAERLPENHIRLRVGIAHVDRCVHPHSEVDRYAQNNTTSVYTGVVTFPMLPDELSSDKTSLKKEQNREAVIVDMTVSEAGEVLHSSLYLALVKNHAKLIYEQVTDFLEGRLCADQQLQLDELQQQLRLQDEAAQRLRKRRVEHGALLLETIEPRAFVEDGTIKRIEVQPKNRARDLIEDLMIAANSVIAQFLKGRRVPSIRRIVRTPKRWEKIVSIASTYGQKLPTEPDGVALSEFLIAAKQQDPERFPDLSLAIVKLLGIGEYVVEDPQEPQTGHFGLATQDYTHSTAPNRRYVDLITQRLLKACLQNTPIPYGKLELVALAKRCTDMTNEAQKVERLMRKAAAASLMQDKIGEVFPAMVTGASDKGTYIRLLTIPIEGKVVHGQQNMDVGDKVRVKLIHVSPEQGFIDFAGIPN